jgi:hypothetical protein
MTLSLFACTPDEGGLNEVGTDDFCLTVTVNKTKVRVGDTVEVAATFKNLSGKDIPIELTDWQTSWYLSGQTESAEKLIVEIVVYPEGVSWGHISILVEPKLRVMLEKDLVIMQTMECRIEEWKNHEVVAGVFFRMGDDYNEFIEILSEPIKIFVRR